MPANLRNKYIKNVRLQYLRLTTRTQNVYYLLLSHGNNSYANATLFYVYTYIPCLVRTWECFSSTDFLGTKILSFVVRLQKDNTALLASCLLGYNALSLYKGLQTFRNYALQYLHGFSVPLRIPKSSSSSSSYICHGDGPLVDPFLFHVTGSHFKGLPWFLLPVGQ